MRTKNAKFAALFEKGIDCEQIAACGRIKPILQASCCTQPTYAPCEWLQQGLTRLLCQFLQCQKQCRGLG